MEKLPAFRLQKTDMSMFNYSHYVDETRLYFAYFLRIPTIKVMHELDSKKVLSFFENEMGDAVQSVHKSQEYNRDKKKLMTAELFFLMKNQFLITLSRHRLAILHDAGQEEEANNLLLQLRRFLKKRSYQQEICMVVTGSEGLETQAIRFTKPKLELSLNYNEDLLPFHKKILPLLQTRGKSGIYLFHGTPGTGKSTYIRYLIRSLKKKVVFIPPALASNFDAPQLSNLLLSNTNSIFVIEDAEQLLTTRDQGRNSAISMLLNLTDGLLGDSLGIQFIATFNTDLSQIDKALLRKGRLLGRYEFKPLVPEKSRQLLEVLGYEHHAVNHPMTLSDIYHYQQEVTQQPERRRIGFLA